LAIVARRLAMAPFSPKLATDGTRRSLPPSPLRPPQLSSPSAAPSRTQLYRTVGTDRDEASPLIGGELDWWWWPGKKRRKYSPPPENRMRHPPPARSNRAPWLVAVPYSWGSGGGERAASTRFMNACPASLIDPLNFSARFRVAQVVAWCTFLLESVHN
jgi:hypothetical protein